MDCPLCALPPEHVIWEDDRCRVIRVDDAAYPGFCRVVWGEHVAEMTDLGEADRARSELAHLFRTQNAEGRGRLFETRLPVDSRVERPST